MDFMVAQHTGGNTDLPHRHAISNKPNHLSIDTQSGSLICASALRIPRRSVCLECPSAVRPSRRVGRKQVATYCEYVTSAIIFKYDTFTNVLRYTNSSPILNEKKLPIMHTMDSESI